MPLCVSCNKNVRKTKTCKQCGQGFCSGHLLTHSCGGVDLSIQVLEKDGGSDGEYDDREKGGEQEQKVVYPKKRRRKGKEKVTSRQEDRSSDEEDSHSEDEPEEDDGGSTSGPPPPVDYDYYSSDDDETPLDAPDSRLGSSARNEFEHIITFLRAVQRLFEGLGEHERVRSHRRRLARNAEEDIHRFSTGSLYRSIQNKEKISSQTSGRVFRISAPVQWLALALLLRDPQYRPCDIIVDLWPGATRNRMCIRGGNSLISPYSGMARTWPSLALELHGVALVLGEAVCSRLVERQVPLKGVERVGHQLLAAIMLHVYKGKGAEVVAFLTGPLGLQQGDLAPLEEFISEFFALSFGVETERLFLTHFETLLHLENIANGIKFSLNPKVRCSRGGTPTVVGQHLFNFLNVFSGVREIGGRNRHVYLPAELQRTGRGKGKDVAPYRGFVVEDDIQQALRFKDSHGRDKSKRSRGKSMVAGGAGFFHLKPFLGGRNKKGHPYRERTTNEVIEAVWQQLRPVLPGEDRGALHAGRLEYMACIRIYNTVANLARRRTRNIALGYWDRRFRYYVYNPELDAQGLMNHVTRLLLGGREQEESWQGSLPALESQLDFEGYVRHLLERAFPVRLDGKTSGLDSLHTYRRTEFCRALDVHLAQEEYRKLLPEAWPLGKPVQDDRWLSNEYMGELLLHQLEFAGPAFCMVPPVDVHSMWWHLTESIIESIDNQRASPQGLSPFLLCPINLSNQHWACFVIEFNRDDLPAPTVYFFDSQGSNPQMLAVVTRIIEDTQELRNPRLVDLSAAIQTDTESCGTWMLEAIRLILQLRLGGVDLTDISGFHVELGRLQGDIGEKHQENLELQQGYAQGEEMHSASANEEVDPLGMEEDYFGDEHDSMSEEDDDFGDEVNDPMGEDVDFFGGEKDPFGK